MLDSHHGDAGRARVEAVKALAAARASDRGPLLPILHDVVAELGYVAEEDIPVIADALNLSRADVLGVVSFYHDFRRTPPAEHEVRICRGEACQSLGAEALYASVTTAYAEEDDIEIREVFCLGNCALGPAGMVDGRIVGRLTPEAVANAIAVPSELPS